MVKFATKKTRKGRLSTDDMSSVSDLSHDDDSTIRSTHSAASKSSTYSKFLHRGWKKKGSNGTASVDGSAAKRSKKPQANATSSVSSGARSLDGRSHVSGGSAGGATDTKRLEKDSKSRYNIGLVYLKTGDYAKAQDNLEHSLYCHIQLQGHDARKYTNETLFAVASVREKLGDCCLSNTAIVDKCLAQDHYEEARRLFKSIALEDASDNVKEALGPALERIEAQLKLPELQSGDGIKRQPPPPPSVNKYTAKYEMHGNAKAKAVLGVGAKASAKAAAGKTPPNETGQSRQRLFEGGGIGAITGGLQTVTGGLRGGLHDVKGHVVKGLDLIKDEVVDVFDSSSEGDERSQISASEASGFACAMSHLQRNSHRTALNYLSSLQEGGSMQNSEFRSQMAVHLMRVADTAMESEKITVATDAYEEAYAVLKQDKDDDSSEKLKKSIRGGIKGHKLLARETEDMRDYSSAIQHRNRVYQLMEEENKCIPAVNQLVMVAYLHGEIDDYAKAAVVLTDAIRRLFKGVQSIDVMAADRIALLMQCYEMRAICFAKSKKWKEALDQYDELLPLVTKVEGTSNERYLTALIHKSALLVTMNNHRMALSTVNQYLKSADKNKKDGLLVKPKDGLLALDTYAACQLKLGNVGKAVFAFEEKLKFINTLPDNKESKSETMHKLGCLLAYKQQHEEALPYLTEALKTRKGMYANSNPSVVESSWALAAASHTLGDCGRALEEYDGLINTMKKVNDLPLNSVTVHNSAGKLYFENGNVDKAIHSFRQALKSSQSSNASPQFQAEIKLNLANGLSAKGESDKAMELYDSLLGTKSLKRTKMFFMTLYNKSLLLSKLGEEEEAKEILNKITETRSSMANDVRGSCYLILGNLSVTEGNVIEALEQYDEALDQIDEEDLNSVTQVKTQIAMAHFQARKNDDAIAVLEEVLEDLSNDEEPNKAINLKKAEVWINEAKIYKVKGDLASAKNFAKLALQTYKDELGESNPITLRNSANLQLLLLAEAEDLPKEEAKPVIDTAKYEMEEILEEFIALDDLWRYRLDVASLKTNLALVAVWQGKPKKARKFVRQLKEIEIPDEHPVLMQIETLVARVEELEQKKGTKSRH